MVATGFSNHTLLSQAECAGIYDTVMRLEPSWIERSARSFYTLGLATYLDGAANKRDKETQQQINLILSRNFPILYERIGCFFQEILGSALFDFDQPLPGFHIFYRHGGAAPDMDFAKRSHFDLQWQQAYPGRIHFGTLSFTLLIRAPVGGAGMAYWNARFDSVSNVGKPARAYALTRPSLHLDYTEGALVLHDGLTLHAIGGGGRESGYRVTLQGHCINLDGAWYLYW